MTREYQQTGPSSAPARQPPSAPVVDRPHGDPQLLSTHALNAWAAAEQPDVCSWDPHDSIVAWFVVAVPPGQMHERYGPHPPEPW